MRVVRKITYEAEDNEYESGISAEERLREQLAHSFTPGTYPLLTTITVEHLEGPEFPSGVRRNPIPAPVPKELLAEAEEVLKRHACVHEELLAAFVRAQKGEWVR